MTVLGKPSHDNTCGFVTTTAYEKLKTENANLRACLGDGCADCAVGMGEYADSLCDPLKAENAKLRKRLAQYELFEDVIGDPSTEFARLRRELHRLQRENVKLRELARRLLTEYRYMRSRPRRVYLGHEERMRAIEGEMRELGIEVDDGR